jgi:hypothetical protein
VIPKRINDVRFEAMEYGFPLYSVSDSESDLLELAEHISAVVTLNDWGDYRALVELARSKGIPTFGKVEGVQDFGDVDVHCTRSAYQTVEHVPCQGPNDYKNTQGQRTIVGSTRLERIWKDVPRHGVEPLPIYKCQLHLWSVGRCP